MKRVLICLAALPLLAGGASAAGRLSDPQLDVITAGETPGQLPEILAINCPGCTLQSSTSTSKNGVTTTTSSTVVVGGSTGGGTTGGSTGGGSTGGSTGGGNPVVGPSVVSSIPTPANLTAVITNALH
jgi:hypothetical protein